MSLNSNISLGTYQPGESGSLMFTVSLPAELKNAYALRDTYVNWIFSVQGAEEVEESQDGTGNRTDGCHRKPAWKILLSLYRCCWRL